MIPGAGTGPRYWGLLDAELRRRGQTVVAVDLPCDDDSAGFAEYADAAVAAIGDRTELVVVAHSLGGFTGPLVCDRVPADLLVMLAAMIPSPGEPAGEWWANTGYARAAFEQAEGDGRSSGEDDPIATFYHDVPLDLAAAAMADERDQSATPMEQPWPLAAWPAVPTRSLLCRDDRCFPAAFMRRVAQERLGIDSDEMAGGHHPMLSRPGDLADRLEAYRAEIRTTRN